MFFENDERECIEVKGFKLTEKSNAIKRNWNNQMVPTFSVMLCFRGLLNWTVLEVILILNIPFDSCKCFVFVCRAVTRPVLILLPVLGLTWLCGVLVHLSVVVAYIFITLNAFQVYKDIQYQLCLSLYVQISLPLLSVRYNIELLIGC